ncbi:MAG TPA: SRPBCC family protein [Gemmatimonadaceae bacterium]|nr:SRPBCC family protein [Gemmatimonadaceae bacterium]
MLAVVLIGYSLPQAHVATVTAAYSAAPADIWSWISQPERYPSWRNGLTVVELLPDPHGRVAWRETGKDGKISYRFTQRTEGTRLVTLITDEGLPFGGGWEFNLQPEGKGSRLTITEHGEVYNPVYRFVSRFFLGHTSTMEGYLTDLGKALGDPVTPQAVKSGQSFGNVQKP